MTATINASAGGVVLTSDTSGTLALQSGGVTKMTIGAGGVTGLEATQAEQEAGSSVVKYTTPGRQQYHPSAAKAWGYSDASGNVAGSYNISSVTDGGSGILTFNFTVAMSSANYVASNTGDANLPGAINSRTTTQCDVRNYNTLTQGLQDSNVHFMAFGDQ